MKAQRAGANAPERLRRTVQPLLAAEIPFIVMGGNAVAARDEGAVPNTSHAGLMDDAPAEADSFGASAPPAEDPRQPKWTSEETSTHGGCLIGQN